MLKANKHHGQILELKAQGFSVRAIAKQLGISKSTVARMAQRPKRDKIGTVPLNGYVPRKCAAPGCKRKFKPVREIQLYCSKRCKNRAAMRRLVQRSQAGRQFVNPVITDELIVRLSNQPPTPRPAKPKADPADEEDESPLERILNAIADEKDLEELSE